MDTSSPIIPIIRAILPKVPLMGKTALYHTLGFSEHSKHWDLRTALTVNVLRSFITDSPPEPISKVQHMSIKDPGIKGRLWVSKTVMPKPEEDDIRQSLFQAIEALKEPGDAPGGFTQPDLLPVEAEWIGYRAGATKNSTDLRIGDAEKYTELMKEVKSPTTILYFHGGAYYLMDPATYRPTTKKLAKLTQGRCLSVRYRLAPQHPFPAALLDALVSYFTLLYPPAGSFHAPVKPEHIVFAGDSAGGNLCLVLLQTLLEFGRQGLKIRWNGEEREAPLPAGVALCSPWAEVTMSSPSCEFNAKYDYLPPSSAGGEDMQFTPCPIWPASPPRKIIYAEDAVICHPLVSPIVAKSWQGSCPIYLETGKELLTDEDKFLAQKAASHGVQVVYEEYEAMPHCFALLLEGTPMARRFFKGWSDFMTKVVCEPETVQTNGTLIRAKTLQEEAVDITKLSSFTDIEVLTRMKEKVKSLSQSNPDPMSKL